MRTLKDLLPKKNILHQSEKSLVLDEKTIFFICKKVLVEEYGARGGENILPSFYKDKKLFLSARSSLWANEVYLARTSLKERINTALGTEAVIEIKVTEGR